MMHPSHLPNAQGTQCERCNVIIGEVAAKVSCLSVYRPCARCGHDCAEHKTANLADGPFVGAYLLICPTALFMDVPEAAGRKRQSKRKPK
jgi:hypothetical protein